MTSQKFRIGIVGCGNISDMHAQAIINSERGELFSAHSRTESRLEAFCDTYDISGSTSYDEFLENPELEAVSICTPSGTHLDYGILAAEAGKHVIVEKPIEVTVERGRALINSCKENGVQLAVIYQNRFIDDVQKMKQMIDAGEIGETILASASVRWFRSQEYYSESFWRGTFELDGGGVVINQSIHTIDLLQWFIGDVESVSGLTGTFTHNGIEAEDTAVASLRFKNGAIGVFEGSTSIVPAQKRRIEVNGATGTALLEGDRFQKKPEADQPEEPEDSGEAAGAASPLGGMEVLNHQRQFEQIFEAFAENRVPVVSGDESLKSLAIVEALYTSAEEKRVVFIDEIL
ncbi:Gfo/Idh/MocA family protein [Rhodohalobacter sp. 8-1]|uniref:Gfo/Idh/MocA family protein n=1 Tax=Rhodohalobacter sp. 8-1 TaxID=3131972 RepID=UPI0030EEC2D5